MSASTNENGALGGAPPQQTTEHVNTNASSLVRQADIAVTFARDLHDQNTAGLEKALPWDRFARYLTEHDRRPDKTTPGANSLPALGFTLARFAGGPCTCGDAPRVGHAGCPDHGLQGAAKGHRIDRNVIAITALGHDLDKREDGAPLTLEDAQRAVTRLQALGVRCVIYSSHSFAPPEKCSMRVIYALSREVAPHEFARFRDAAYRWIGLPAGCKPSGRHFWWAPSARPDATTVVAHAFNGAPLDVDAILATAPVVEHMAPVSGGGPSSFGPASELVIESARARLVKHGPATQDKNGDDHTRAAWGILVNDYALSEEEARPLLLDWNATCVPPWSEAELFAGPARSLGQTWNGVHGESRVNAETAADMDPTTWMVEAPPCSPVSSVLDLIASIPPPAPPPEPGTWEHAYATAQADVKRVLGKSTGTRGIPRPLFQQAGAFLAREFPRVTWDVRGLVKTGGTLVVGGEPKTTKTWVLQEFANAIATGTKAFGEFETGEPKRVGYFYAEDLEADVKAHMLALAKSAKYTPAQTELLHTNLYLEPRGEFLNLNDDDDVARVVASARLIGDLDVIFLEPLRDLHEGEENSSDGMALAMKRLRIIGKLTGATVGVAHHNKKGGEGRGGEKLRGSNAIHGSVDSGVYLSGLRGNGVTIFTNTLTSEIKGARSAGSFELTLTIVDGPDDRAELATWTLDRGGGIGQAGGRRHRYKPRYRACGCDRALGVSGGQGNPRSPAQAA